MAKKRRGRKRKVGRPRKKGITIYKVDGRLKKRKKRARRKLPKRSKTGRFIKG